MDQRMGRPAQDAFKLQCSRARITCNPSLEDDHGWDFFVEIPPMAPAGTPDDKLPAARPALVQVKSTQRARRRLTMKVSNALELAKRPAPCFLVLYHEAEGKERTYARLFGKEDMARALRRGRKLFVEGKPTHRATMTFGFSEDEERTSDLPEWLVACVQGLAEDYGAQKRKLAETVGYGDKNYRAKITFVGIGGVDDLVDLELGIKDHLEVSRFTVFDERFGIEAPEPILDREEPAVFRMQPTREIECVVTLETKDDTVSMPSKARASVALQSSPEQAKLAFVNELFGLVVSVGGIKLEMRATGSTKLPIAHLAQLATMLSWGEDEFRIRVTGDDAPEIDIPTVKVMQIPALDRSVAAAIRTLRTTEKRGQATGIRLSLDDVMSARAELMVYYAVLTAGRVGLSTEWMEPSFDHEAWRNLLGYIDVEVGGYTFLTLFDAAIETRLEERRNLLVELGRRNVRDCVVGNVREKVRAKGQTIYEQCGGGYGDDWLPIGSVNALIESSPQRT